MAPPVSPFASLNDFPVSTATIRAISSARAFIRITISCKISPRRTAGVSAHASCAARAAATAAFISAASDLATEQRTDPSCGLNFSELRPLCAATSLPLIQLRMRDGNIELLFCDALYGRIEPLGNPIGVCPGLHDQRHR